MIEGFHSRRCDRHRQQDSPITHCACDGQGPRTNDRIAEAEVPLPGRLLQQRRITSITAR